MLDYLIHLDTIWQHVCAFIFLLCFIIIKELAPIPFDFWCLPCQRAWGQDLFLSDPSCRSRARRYQARAEYHPADPSPHRSGLSWPGKSDWICGEQSVVRLNLQRGCSYLKHNTRPTLCCGILLVPLSGVGGHRFVQRLKLFLVLDDGLSVDLHSRDLDVDSSSFPRTFGWEKKITCKKMIRSACG